MSDPYIDGFYTAANVPLVGVWDRDDTVTPDSNPMTCEYIHFDLSSENLGRTERYNCWGFTFLPRRYWLSRTDVDNIIRDNCISVPDGSIQLGDVVRYKDDYNITQHTGRVWETDGNGHATLIRSKWGSGGEYIHEPLFVPSVYGTNLAYFRQFAPLRGNINEIGKIADLWIRDSPHDDGEQYSEHPWWISPDILVDVPPYDGAPDLNPVFNQTNHVWAIVSNRCNQRVENVYIRLYWANPSIGLAPTNWNLIPSTAEHPNPIGPFSIDANSNTETDYVEWIPATSSAHQCLLAIAYINDNPQDSLNPDPLIYPFDIPWENNIAQRNVNIIELPNGSNSEFSIQVRSPFKRKQEVKGNIYALLTYSSQLPILNFPKKVVTPNIIFLLDKKEKMQLEQWKSVSKIEIDFMKRKLCKLEKPLAIMEFPSLIFTPNETHRLDVKVDIPQKIKIGSIYYLHMFQKISNQITGGYTAIILII